MLLEQVRIVNFKGIDEASFNFKPGLNLIIGENGAGKTSVLEAIAVGLGGFIAGVPDVKTRHFAKQDVRMSLTETGEASSMRKYHLPLEVVCRAHLREEIVEWKRNRLSIQDSRSTVQPRKVCRLAEAWTNSETETLPLISYHSAARIWSKKKEKPQNLFRQPFSRSAGYIDCLEEASNSKLLTSWFARMEQISWQKERAMPEYEAVKRIASAFMTRMNGRQCQIGYDKLLEDLIYLEDGERKLFSELSAGYLALAWTVLDLAFRVVVLNPKQVNRIEDMQGVVLIDEIDMHLHPRWQWRVMEALRETFPNVQFLLTTHSPIVIASARNVWVIDVTNLREIRESRAEYGFDVNHTLQLIQQANALPGEVLDRIRGFYRLIETRELDLAREALEQMEAMYGEESPEVVKARVTLELEEPFAED